MEETQLLMWKMKKNREKENFIVYTYTYMAGKERKTSHTYDWEEEKSI